MNFDFIADQRFRTLLSRDYLELQKCLENDASKSALVLSGSILEAALSDFFIQFPVNGKSESSILQSNLGTLIEIAESEKIITSKEKNLAAVVKDYRNLIHPGKEIRKGEKFNSETATIAAKVVDIILKSIKDIYISKYGHTAEEILERLKHDWHYQSVFDKVVIKLNQNEKLKLLKLLVNFDIEEKSHWESFSYGNREIRNGYYDLEFVKPLTNQLKTLLPKEVIRSYLKKLLLEVEIGSKVKAYCLYNLFHDNIDELEPKERELIVIYMLGFAISLLDNTGDIALEKTYSTIGKYIQSTKTKEALKKFIEDYSVNSSGSEKDLDIFEHVINGLEVNLRTEMLQYLTDFLPTKENAVPYLDKFYNEADKRRLILEKKN
jgi:hypothetical protein